MARRKRRGSLRKASNLKKALGQLKKDDLVRLALQAKAGKKVRRKGKKAGSYARRAPRDRFGRLLPKGSRRVRRTRRRASKKTRRYLTPSQAAARVRTRSRRTNYISPAQAAARIRALRGTPVAPKTVVVVSAPRKAPTVMSAREFAALRFKFNRSKKKGSRGTY